MQTTVPPVQSPDATCAGAGAVRPPVVAPQAIFPPKDADAETRRRWLASSPWPEVVFASAGA